VSTIPEPIAALLPPLVDDLRATLANDLVGVYLYGSAVLGGFEPDASDLDLVIVTERDAADLDLAVIEALHRRLASREPDWADRLDIAYIGRATLATFRSGGILASISHDEPLQRYDDADGWLQTWYLVREADVAILGPSPRTLIPPIDPAEFVRAVVRTTSDLAARTLATGGDNWLAYTLVTQCRVLRTLEDGAIGTKAAAAEAMARSRPDRRCILEACLAFGRTRGRLPLDPDARRAAPDLIAHLRAEIDERVAALER
jgi:streptomycin 3"-adenylyltransferase